jgi:hypothetical protein
MPVKRRQRRAERGERRGLPNDPIDARRQLSGGGHQVAEAGEQETGVAGDSALLSTATWRPLSPGIALSVITG